MKKTFTRVMYAIVFICLCASIGGAIQQGDIAETFSWLTALIWFGDSMVQRQIVREYESAE